ncbi:hypothetical protein GLW08_03585 [Pontibacillus yanchengensis]|uniref:Uncharacterized protein n=2 Tax=Pontibacillus yanchengensis TaxID=462910 RepID=A0A6I5A500_9BACI|nr:hypothetical protein [Pontibacillus yanchengensis]MYL35387.1 hypothetical protein [Pontibacillus yanchengensis]MYL52417.1 hypothetical protein [Pontibacillus yanchengensis]
MVRDYLQRRWKIWVLWYVLTIGGVALLLYGVSQPLDYFLSHVFPDPATDDLTLNYVLEHLGVLFWVFFMWIIAIMVLGAVERFPSLIVIAGLYFNILIFLLLRSNFEFYIWVIQGPQPDYGGLGAGIAALSTFGVASLWLIVEYIQFMIRENKLPRNDREGPSLSKMGLWLFRGIGVFYFIIVSLVHFYPLVFYVSEYGL